MVPFFSSNDDEYLFKFCKNSHQHSFSLLAHSSVLLTRSSVFEGAKNPAGDKEKIREWEWLSSVDTTAMSLILLKQWVVEWWCDLSVCAFSRIFLSSPIFFLSLFFACLFNFAFRPNEELYKTLRKLNKTKENKNLIVFSSCLMYKS